MAKRKQRMDSIKHGASGNLRGTFAGLMSGDFADGSYTATIKLEGRLGGDSSARKTSKRKFATSGEAGDYIAGAEEGAGWSGYVSMLATPDGTKLVVKWGSASTTDTRPKTYKFSQKSRMLAFVYGAKAAVGWDELVDSSIDQE